MKYILYFLFFLLFCFKNNTYGQSLLENKTYLKNIEIAEDFIVAGKYDSASIYYEYAFSPKSQVNTIDIYNASIVNIKNKNYSTAKSLMDNLILRGFDMNFFIKNSNFKEMQNNDLWLGFIQSYSENRIKYISNNNWKLRCEIEALFAKDQYYYDRENRDNVTSQEWLSLHNETLNELNKIFIEFGYPSDNKIGVFILNDTTYVQVSPIHILIRHLYQDHDFSLTPKLLEFVYSGNIDPEEFMTWHGIELQETTRGERYGVEPYWIVNGTVYKIKSTPKQVEDIKNNRRNLNACTLEQFCKKIEYQEFKCKNMFNLCPWGAFAIMNLSKEAEESLSKFLIKTQF